MKDQDKEELYRLTANLGKKIAVIGTGLWLISKILDPKGSLFSKKKKVFDSHLE